MDEDEINAKFAIASTFVKETATYISNRGKEVDRAKKALDTEKEKTADERDDALVAQLEQQYKTALIENETWLPGGTGRKVVNALNAAVGGNLSAGATQFVQMGVANYLQQEGASLLGEWTREGKLTEGSPLHAALHGAVGCLGAAAGGGDCGAGGMGAATSSLLTHLFTDQPDETVADKETKRDIIVGLTTAMALGTNLDPGTAMNSAVSSVDNNYLTQSQLDDWIEAAKTCTPGAECDALNKSYLQLDRAQQDQLIVDCASDYAACRQKYSFIFGENDETWDRIKAAREFISSSVLLNIGLSQNDAEGAVFSASLAQGLKERFNLDPDKVQLALDIAMAMTSGTRGGAQRGSASGHQTHVQASSGNTNTGRHTEQPSSHTSGNVATSSGDVNKHHTGDNASSVGQNETANHSGVDGSGGANTVRGSDVPYSSREIRDDLVSRYGIGNVTSTTVPPLSKPNVRLAGQYKTIELPDGTTTRVVFDQKGFPIFDDVAKFDTQLNIDKFKAKSYDAQLRMATRNLRSNIRNGNVSENGFSESQLKAINGGFDKIPGYTWHHHQNTGRMQLVPEAIHGGARHVGWESMSKGQ